MMSAAGGDVVNVEDVFSVNNYQGNGSAQAITNGIDLSTYGGLVWTKRRNTNANHRLFSDELSTSLSHSIIGDQNFEMQTDSTNMASFNTNGFTVNGGDTNASGNGFCAWTFRKQPNFFDVVKYTGSGSAKNISHDLGAVPGCIMVKRLTTASADWAVYHRGLGTGSNAEDYVIHLNNTYIQSNDTTAWNSTSPTSTQFTVGTSSETNASGSDYIAFIFAHNDGDGTFGATGDQDIIKCGFLTGDGLTQSSAQQIDLGFEPQYLMGTVVDDYESWYILDHKRGFTTPLDGRGDDAFFKADEFAPEGTRNMAERLANGFIPFNKLNVNTMKHIYIAIRSPMKKLSESGETYFDYYQGSDTVFDTVAFPPDIAIHYDINSAYPYSFISARALSSTGASNALQFANPSDSLGYPSSSFYFGYDEKTVYPGVWGSSQYRGLYFKQRPGFFHVSGYYGSAPNGAAATYTKRHGLEAVPEMIWLKSADVYNSNFLVWHKNMPSNTDSYTNRLYMNLQVDNGRASSNYWGYQTDPTLTNTSFTVGSDYDDTNKVNSEYVAFTFATDPGVSKVGSYTGTGTTQNIDCGFSSTASVVLIKRADTSGHWLLYDKNMGGIASGSVSKAYRLDTGGGYVTENASDLNPYSSGFQLPSTATDLNTNNGHYIYWAVA